MIDDELFDNYGFRILSDMSMEEDVKKIPTECVSLILDNMKNLNVYIINKGNLLIHSLIYVYVDENINSELQDEYGKIIINILKRGANPTIENHNGFTAFSLAVDFNNFELLKLLVDNSNFDVGIEAVICAMYEDNYDIVEYLLPLVENINEKTRDRDDSDGFNEHTIMWYAKRYERCNKDILELLEMHGAHDY